MTKNVEAKEVFDYLYNIKPTFRQNLVESVKVEQGENVKKMFIITKKDGKDYRMVVMKEKNSQELQLIDEGYITVEKPTATIVTENSDSTQTITTNKISESQVEVKTVIETLKKNNIKADIESLQYTEGPKSIEYVVVLTDTNGQPTKQVTITENKETKETTIIDYTTLEVK